MWKKPTVFVVDDDEELRESLQWTCQEGGLEVRTYGTAEEFLAAYDPEASGCILLDVCLPGEKGLELQETMVRRGCDLPVVILSAQGDVPTAVRAMEAGAAGVVEKPFDRQLLLDQVHKAVQRDALRRQSIREKLEVDRRLSELTPREREVMGLVVGGRTTKQIADELGVSARTIEVHRSRIMKKMQVGNLAALVTVAVRYQIVDA